MLPNDDKVTPEQEAFNELKAASQGLGSKV